MLQFLTFLLFSYSLVSDFDILFNRTCYVANSTCYVPVTYLIVPVTYLIVPVFGGQLQLGFSGAVFLPSLPSFLCHVLEKL